MVTIEVLESVIYKGIAYRKSEMLQVSEEVALVLIQGGNALLVEANSESSGGGDGSQPLEGVEVETVLAVVGEQIYAQGDGLTPLKLLYENLEVPAEKIKNLRAIIYGKTYGNYTDSEGNMQATSEIITFDGQSNFPSNYVNDTGLPIEYSTRYVGSRVQTGTTSMENTYIVLKWLQKDSTHFDVYAMGGYTDRIEASNGSNMIVDMTYIDIYLDSFTMVQ